MANPFVTGYVYRGNPVLELHGRKDGGAWTKLKDLVVDGSKGEAADHYKTTVTVQVTDLATGNWDFKTVVVALKDIYTVTPWVTVGQNSVYNIRVKHLTCSKTRLVSYLPTGGLTTSFVGFSSVPALASRLEIDDIVPAGCSATYHAYGGNTVGVWNDLGTVVDGSTLPAYRFYYFAVAITSNGTDTPFLDEIRVIGGNSQYLYFSTHKDTPIQGAKPYIAPGGISSISSKIDLSQSATIGELTAKLHWTKEVGDMISTGYLKNKTIICKIGFVGLSEQDYEPYFVGTWYDYQADHEKRIITVKTRNILKRFNRKVPSADYFLDAAGQAFAPPKLLTLAGNIMDVMLQLADLLGVPDRYLDRSSFTGLAAGSRSGPAWQVSRSITEPMDANELLNELAVSAGVFLVEGPDGKLTAQLYDDVVTSNAVDTLDAKLHKFRPIDGGQKELFTRQTIYYQLISGKPGSSASDFGKGLVYVNVNAEIAWQESATKEWMDKWGLSVTAIQKLAQRRDGWFANPLATVKVENVPPRFWGIKTGQIVAVDNLQFPCPSNEWQGFTDGTRFLVMSKTTNDPTSESLAISYDLMQLGTPAFIPDPDFPSYTPFEYFPAVRNLALSEHLVRLAGGSVETMLDVDFDRPIDFHYGSAAIWSRPAGGTWKYKGLTDLGGPEDARVFSFAVSDSQTVEVAALTVNAVGQTMPIDMAPKVSRFIIGKTAPPANVTNFHAIPIITGGLRFSWSSVADVDVSEYVIRYSPKTNGAVWDGASEIIRSSALYANLNTALSGTYFIKAIDTTGHYSPAAASYVVSAILSQISLTNHVTITEHTGWSGTKDRCHVTSGELIIDQAYSVPGNPPPISSGAIYTSATEVSFAEPVTVRVSAKCDWIALIPSFDSVQSIDNMASWDGATGKSTVQAYITTSQDGSAPSFKQPLFAGDYTFQRAKFSVEVIRWYPDFVKIKELVFNVELHDTAITI
jgi:hypothetical protein